MSFILRLLFWKSNAYFEVEAMNFSLLGGRISFTDLRYISRNQSFRVVEGASVGNSGGGGGRRVDPGRSRSQVK